jgi:hypothetical protein
MSSTQKKSLSEIDTQAMYSAREIFQFENPFAHSVQLNRFLVADMCKDNLFKTIMHKTSTKTRFFVPGSELKKHLGNLTKEYILTTIEEYDSKA